ncbi:MAG: hypothetical protein ACI83N_000356 [Hydrogenophaga sp.]|jgi:hypothetical protein
MEKYIITFTAEEAEQLQSLVGKGKHAAQKVINALILLNCDQSQGTDHRRTSQDIAQVLQVSERKIDRVKRRFVQDGLEVTLSGQPSQREYVSKVDGEQPLNHAQTLAQGQAEQTLDAQAERDGCVGEGPLAPPLAAGRGVPRHVFVPPDRQLPPGFERGVVRSPVGGLVERLGALGFGHVPRLPARELVLCNKAGWSMIRRWSISARCNMSNAGTRRSEKRPRKPGARNRGKVSLVWISRLARPRR